MTSERHEYISLGLPLPVDVFATLGDLINKAWPGASIITDPENAGVPQRVRSQFGWGHGSQYQLIRIDTGRAPKRVSKKAATEVVEANAAETEPLDFLGFDDEGWVKMAPPEELSLHLGAIGRRLLECYPDAINYVEWQIVDREDNHRRYVLSVARSKGQTPGALRQKAEEENARLRELLREARGYARDHGTPEDFGARVARALGE